jgi:long-chain fatty acid transport protein
MATATQQVPHAGPGRHAAPAQNNDHGTARASTTTRTTASKEAPTYCHTLRRFTVTQQRIVQKTVRRGAKTGLAFAVTAALALPLAAQAGSFQLPTNNAAGWARAGAGGSLFPDDPSAVYNNPAATAFFSGPLLQITGTGIRPSAKYHGDFNDISGAPVSGGNPDGFGKFKPFPNLAFAAPVNDRLTLGGSITVPFGLEGDYNPDWQGRYFGTKTTVESVAATFSLGFKVNDEFAIGLGIVGQYTKAQLNTVLDVAGTSTALNTLGLPTPLLRPQSQDVQLNANVKRKFSLGYIGSFVWKPTQEDTIGFSYHSRIRNKLSGDYKLYGSPVGIQLLSSAHLLNPAFPSVNPAGDNASARLDMPAFASLDWVHAFTDRFSLAASASWFDWSSFDKLSMYSNGQLVVALPQGYKDSWTYAIGGEYKITPTWTLRAGVGYDQTPTNSTTRDPRIPDQSRRLVGVGVGYYPTEHLSIDFGYQHQFVSDARVHQQNSLLLGGGTMDGKFDDKGDVVSITGTYHFK